MLDPYFPWLTVHCIAFVQSPRWSIDRPHQTPSREISEEWRISLFIWVFACQSDSWKWCSECFDLWFIRTTRPSIPQGNWPGNIRMVVATDGIILHYSVQINIIDMMGRREDNYSLASHHLHVVNFSREERWVHRMKGQRIREWGRWGWNWAEKSCYWFERKSGKTCSVIWIVILPHLVVLDQK